MPLINADGCHLWVEVEGPQHAPALMLSNSLGTNLHMWDAQLADFARSFHLVRYDRRGHGRSDVPAGPYTMERLARDALAVADGLHLEKFHWCGLSMGGMEGMWLAAHAPERVDRLILSNTTCHYSDKGLWNARIAAIRASGGLGAFADRIMRLWFSPQFRANAPEAIAPLRSELLAMPVEGYLACCAAIRDMDHRDILASISMPTLIIAGQFDEATPVTAAQFIHDRITGAALQILDAAHICNIEQPRAYAQLVLEFLAHRA